mgnify:CR=1 FL=1
MTDKAFSENHSTLEESKESNEKLENLNSLESLSNTEDQEENTSEKGSSFTQIEVPEIDSATDNSLENPETASEHEATDNRDLRIKKSDKIPDKGFRGSTRKRVKDSFKVGEEDNLLEDEVDVSKTEEKYSSESRKKNKFSDISLEVLKTWRERYKEEIEIFEIDYNNANIRIKDLVEEKRDTTSLSEARSLQRRIDDLTEIRDKAKYNLEKYESDVADIEEVLSNAEFTENHDRKQRVGNQGQGSSEVSIDITPDALFTGGDRIQNTILYVASYFSKLSPKDFKELVFLLLQQQENAANLSEEKLSESDEKNEEVNLESDKSVSSDKKIDSLGSKEHYEIELLSEIWKKSFDGPDKYIKASYLKLYNSSSQKWIDFSVPSFKDEFPLYLEREQPFFLEEQFKHTQNLSLILHYSDDIAEKAISLSARIAADSPSIYEEKWLLETSFMVLEECNSHSDSQSKVVRERRIHTLLTRLANLVYELQIQPNYSKSEDIAQRFLENFAGPKDRFLAFFIFQHLIDRHLRSGVLGTRPAKNLLTWLKQWLEKSPQLSREIYNSIQNILWRSGTYSYIYDFLALFEDWLPDKNCTVDKFSLSNIIALKSVFSYCAETTERLPLGWYGEWPSIHPLFKPLEANEFKCSENFGNLIDWLIFSCAIENIASLSDIAYLVAEWFAILFGLEDQEQNIETTDLSDCLLCSIIQHTNRSQRKELNDNWTSLVEDYLDIATIHKEEGRRDFKKHFIVRRNLVRRLKKRFKALQKES